MDEPRIDAPIGVGEAQRPPLTPRGGWPARPWDVRSMRHPGGARVAHIACLPDGTPVRDAEGFAVTSGPGMDYRVVRARWSSPSPSSDVTLPDVSGRMRDSLVEATLVARDHGRPYVGVEHVALGILRLDEPTSSALDGVLDARLLDESIARFNDGPAWRERLDLVAARRAGTADRPPAVVPTPWAAPVGTLLTSATALARRMGVDQVTPLHLLLVELLGSRVPLRFVLGSRVDISNVFDRVRSVVAWRPIVDHIEGRSSAGTDWRSGLAAFDAAIECGGGTHAIRFENGELLLHDHDVPAEEALSALDPSTPLPPCVAVLRTWRDTCEDPALQVVLGECAGLTPGSPELQKALDDAALHVAWLGALAPSMFGVRSSGPVPDFLRKELDRMSGRAPAVARTRVSLLSLSPDVRFALGAVIARRPSSPAPMFTHEWEGFPNASNVLIGGLVAHLGPGSDLGESMDDTVRRSPRQVPNGIVIDTYVWELTVRSSPGVPASASAKLLPLLRDWHGISDDGLVVRQKVVGEVNLPPRWLPTVYARGLCADPLVLEVLESSPDERRLLVRACRWEDDPPVLRVRRAEMTAGASRVWETRWLPGGD